MFPYMREIAVAGFSMAVPERLALYPHTLLAITIIPGFLAS